MRISTYSIVSKMSTYKMFKIKNTINNYVYYGFTKGSLQTCMEDHVRKSETRISTKSLKKMALDDDIHVSTLYYMMQRIECNEYYFTIHPLESHNKSKRKMQGLCKELQQSHNVFRIDNQVNAAKLLNVTNQIDKIRSKVEDVDEAEYSTVCPWRNW